MRIAKLLRAALFAGFLFAPVPIAAQQYGATIPEPCAICDNITVTDCTWHGWGGVCVGTIHYGEGCPFTQGGCEQNLRGGGGFCAECLEEFNSVCMYEYGSYWIAYEFEESPPEGQDCEEFDQCSYCDEGDPESADGCSLASGQDASPSTGDRGAGARLATAIMLGIIGVRIRRNGAVYRGLRNKLFRSIRCLAPGSVALLFLPFACASAAETDVAESYQIAIALEPVVAFGDIGDPVLLDDSPTGLRTLARDSRGRYFAPSFRRQQVVVFDSTGHFLGTLGSSGGGPGEFRGLVTNIMIHAHDSVFVVASRQVSVFDPELEFVRSFILPLGFGAGLLLPNSELIVQGVMLPERANRFHRISPQGDLLESFGADPSQPQGVAITMAHGTSGFWASTITRYGAEQWSYSGGTRLALTEGAGFEWTPRTDRPFFIWREDPAGVLWALLHVRTLNPLPERPAGVPPPQRGSGTRILTREEVRALGVTANSMHDVSDTIVALLDAITGEVIASRRLDLVLRPVQNSNLLFSQHEDEFGVPSIKVWNLDG